MLKDPDGHQTLSKLFDWFVSNTKDHRRFHVILGTSDSFFNLWLSIYIGSSRYESIIIGDISKVNAT